MAEKSFLNLLQQSFPKTDKESWKKTATGEVGGNEPFTQLRWNDKDQLEFFPYYDSSDVEHLAFQQKFILPPSREGFLGNRSWFNAPLVTVNDEMAANKISLSHLSNGADGIFFQIKNNSCDLKKLLNEIKWEYCFLSFQGVNQSFVDNLIEFLKNQPNTHQFNGCIFWDELPQKRNLDQFAKINFYGYHVPYSTPVKEIHDALVYGADLLSSSESPDKIISQISFSFDTSADFLHQVSKLKAMRLLWYQVSQAFKIADYKPGQLHLHARSEAWINQKFQPHGNMLKSTVASMAAIVGGCDSLTVMPEDENNNTMSRIARNVSSVLREESYLDKVSDPLAGAYTIEVMVEKIAQHAWSMFQETMKKNA